MEQTLAQRLKEYIDSTEYNNSQFADLCGIPRPTLSQILTGRNKKVSNQLLEQLHATFPDLSILWLIFGEGAMRVSDNTPPLHTPTGEKGRFNQSSPANPSALFMELEGTEIIESPFSENLKNSGIPPSPAAQPNVEALTGQLYTPMQAVNKQLASESKIKDLQSQIEKMQLQIDQIRENPRKVLQITVYYDDSTFETFVPGK